MGLRRGTAWSCTGALLAAVHGRSMGLRRRQHGAAHERSLGLRMSAAWGCAWGVPRGVHGGGGASPQAVGVPP